MTTLLILLPSLLVGGGTAPGPADLEEALTELNLRLERARSLAGTTARIQNALAEGFVAGETVCSMSSLALRSEVFGSAHRDAAQAAATQAARIERMVASPTLAPLLDAGFSPQSRADPAEAWQQERLQREFAAWHKRHVTGLGRCGATLEPVEGLPAPTPEDAALVPSVLVLEGVLCPGALPPGVHVAAEGCWAPEPSCGCESALLLPGQVLGPERQGPL